MLLHVVNRSPATSRVYQQALAAMSPDDRLLLIEDGVQGALPQLVRYYAGLEGRLFALKELPLGLAEQEYNLLLKMKSSACRLSSRLGMSRLSCRTTGGPAASRRAGPRCRGWPS